MIGLLIANLIVSSLLLLGFIMVGLLGIAAGKKKKLAMARLQEKLATQNQAGGGGIVDLLGARRRTGSD